MGDQVRMATWYYICVDVDLLCILIQTFVSWTYAGSSSFTRMGHGEFVKDVLRGAELVFDTEVPVCSHGSNPFYMTPITQLMMYLTGATASCV